MPGKLIETYQVKVYMNARELGLTQAEAAYVAQFSERSGQRIESGDYQPNRGKVREWRTSADPLAEVWESELEPMLRATPKLKPMTLFEYLQTKYPGKYPQVLRTLQRRVATWKALHGPAPEVMFELRHEPGMMGFSDFTELKGIEITLNGQPFEHLIYHYRLGYSGWQYAQIIQGGESFIALSEGLQNALFACGGAPKQHRTDSLSAAYRNLGGGRSKPLTRLYDDLCHHYRMQPTRNNTGIAHENGSIESPHGHLKNRIEQALLLRGSCNFSSIGEYQAVINQAVDRLNAQHAEKIADEKAYLQPLPQGRVADYEILTARVSCRSTIDVRCVLYTVPARLIGAQLELHLYHDRMVGYWHRQQVVELPRILEAIYEPTFLDTSYGFRAGRSCHDALRQLNSEMMRQRVNWVADLDLAQFFDTMPHQEILSVLALRIKDRKFLRLIARMLRAGVQTPGGVVVDELGSPQGSIVSPVIANIFLDHVLDQWFSQVVRQHCRGYCSIIRYADDTMVLFEREDDAHRFMRVLPLRLAKFGLTLNQTKTQLLRFGKQAAWQAIKCGNKLPTFDFLGFTHYWGRSRTGKVRLKRKTSKKRLRRALVDLKHWLRQERNARKLPQLWQAIRGKMRGHFNYFGVTDNSRALYQFERAVHNLLFKWLNRRSHRRSFTWDSFLRYMARYPLPRPGRLVSLFPVG